MKIETLSAPPVLAFTNQLGAKPGNPQDAQPIQYFTPTNVTPTGDGIYNIGQGGSEAANRVKIWPFAEAMPGDVFWLRLWAWNCIAFGDNAQVWMPSILAQFACMVGAITVPTDGNSAGRQSVIAPWERFCDGLALVGGWLGLTGEIISQGAGSGIGACALVELRGSQKIQFEFERSDHTIGMNALWARA